MRWMAFAVGAVLPFANVAHPADIPGTTEKTMEHGGLQRIYRVHVPPSCDGSKPVPLVVAFHGGGGSAEAVERGYHFNPLADKDGFIVVYPQGYPDPPTGNHFNDGRVSPRFPKAQTVDDVGFVRALVEHIKKEYKIDSRRIYATGLSNGGFMSHRLGMDLSDIFAGIGAVAGTLGTDVAKNFAPTHPVHVIDIHGTKDGAVPIAGGMVKAQGGLCIGVTNMMELWVKTDGCKTPPTVESLPKTTTDSTHVTRTVYKAGDNGAEVVLYVVDGMGHTWAGNGLANGEGVTKELHAEEVFWNFFKEHPKVD